MLRYFIAVILIVSFVLTACTPPAAPAPTQQPVATASPKPTQTQPPAATQPPAKKPLPKELTFYAAPPAGSGLPISQALSGIITKYLGIKTTAVPSEGTTENIRRLTSKEGDLGYLANDTNAYFAVRGREPFGPEKAPLMYLFSGGGSAYYVFTLEESSIKTPADFRGKRVTFRHTGMPLMEMLRKPFLAAYGMTDNDITLLACRSMGEACQQLKDGVTDAVVEIGAIPMTAVTELASIKKLRYLSIEDDKLAAILKEYPGNRQVIPAGMYPNQTSNYVQIGAKDGIGVRNDMDEELGYQITKCVYDHYDELVPMHAAFRGWSLKTVTGSWAAPYNPGAIKYFKEKGVWTGDADTKQAAVLKEVKG